MKSASVLFGAILVAWLTCSGAASAPSELVSTAGAAEPVGLFSALGKASHAAKTVGEMLEMQLGSGADATKKVAHGLQRSADEIAQTGSKVNDALSRVTDRAAEVGHKAVTGLSETADKLANLFKRDSEEGRMRRESARMADHDRPRRRAAVHEEDHLESRRMERSRPDMEEEREVHGQRFARPEARQDPSRAWPERPAHLPPSMRKEAFEGEGMQQSSSRVPVMSQVPQAGPKPGLSYTKAKRAALKQARAEGLIPNPRTARPSSTRSL